MYLLAIVGSPRKKGNTDLLVDLVIDGVTETRADARVEKIYVNDLDLKPCLGTLSCRKTGKCVIDDDMGPVLDRIKAADGLIMASPIYRGYLPGQMKIFADRMTPLEKEIDMAAAGGGSAGLMKALMRLTPGFVQKMIMKSMISKYCSAFRLEKKVNSVIVVVGGHPGEMAVMKEDMRRVEEEMGFVSMVTGGKVVATVRAPGVLEKAAVLKHTDVLNNARDAGKRLALSLAA